MRPITEKDAATGEEKVKTYMFMRGNSRYIAGSRFKYMRDCIPFSYDNLVDAIHDAIDLEAKENDGKFVQSERNNLYSETGSTKSFDEVMNEFNDLTKQLMDKGVQYTEIVSVIEGVLGAGKLVKDCTKEQQSLVELINDNLQELIDNAS